LWRYVSAIDLVRLAIANTSSFFGSLRADSCSSARLDFRALIYLLDLMICFLLTSGLQAGGAHSAWKRRRSGGGAAKPRSGSLIYGAGGAGTMRCCARFAAIRGWPIKVVGFVDDLAERPGPARRRSDGAGWRMRFGRWFPGTASRWC
jgi:hypothetical protein